MLPAEIYDPLRRIIRQDEGYRAFPYKDSRGIETIGVGRNLQSVGLHDDEIELMLTNDIEDSWLYLSRYDWFAKLDPVRQAALIDMMFNLGPAKFALFTTMIGHLSRAEYANAAAAALDSTWAAQVGERARRDADMIATGEWPS